MTRGTSQGRKTPEWYTCTTGWTGGVVQWSVEWSGGFRPKPAATRVMSLPVERSNLSIGPVSPGATGATEVMFLLITEALCGTK